VIEVDEAKLRGAVLNLISNAVHATQPGDVIGLTVSVVDGVVRFDVDDSGPGVPAERREILLERFARPGAADSEGTGLGLAIARVVAQGHGGQLALLDSPLGGLRARILLPASVIRETP
jgi:signal transduction histidine kinase